MTSVTAGGPGLVAVGRSDDFGGGEVLVENVFIVEGDAVVWTSVDGLSWSRLPHNEDVFGGAWTQEMLAVTVGGPGLVAVGRDGAGSCWCNPILWSGGQHPAVWTSPDGLSWSRVPHDDNDFAESSDRLLAVTAGGPGLVAVGYNDTGPAPVWTSIDGLSWTPVTHENPTEMRGWMSDVTVGGPGLVAFGSSADQHAVWTSTHGLEWSPAPNIAIPLPQP